MRISNHFVIILFILGSFFMISCSDDEEATEPDPDPKEEAKGTFSATIDGAAWEAETVTVDHYKGAIYIDADTDDKSVGLTLQNTATVGTTYQIRGASINYSASYFEGIQSYALDEGEIVLSTHDTENRLLTGTFSFTCEDVNTGKVVTITEGAFSVNYPEPRE